MIGQPLAPPETARIVSMYGLAHVSTVSVPFSGVLAPRSMAIRCLLPVGSASEPALPSTMAHAAPLKATDLDQADVAVDDE